MIGIIILSITAFILSTIITFVSTKFDNEAKIYKDLLNLLPGYNCGACGYEGCKSMAHHILENKENYKKCKPLKGNNLREMEMFIKKEL